MLAVTAADQPRSPRERVSPKARELRARHQARWVDLQVEQAIARGEFDDLPGAGRPIPDLDEPVDEDWWLRRLVEREKISLLPPALALRTEDARLHETLDGIARESEVREALEDFNARIVEARRQLLGGPPVITPLRDIEAEITAWRERRRTRAAAHTPAPDPPRRRRFRRRR